MNPDKRLTRVIDHDVALLRAGYWYPVVANRQSTDLKHVIHDALEVRLTILHGDHVVAEKCGAVPQTEVMPELVHERRGLHEIGSDEVVPESKRDHHVAAAAASPIPGS